jgi:hypothetical protein
LSVYLSVYKPWCSTKAVKEGRHICKKGFWGYCGPQCNEKMVSGDLGVEMGDLIGDSARQTGKQILILI